MFRSGTPLILFFLLVVLQGCAASRPAVPVGTIPAAQTVTPEEEQHGHTVLAALTEKYELDYNHPRYQEVLDIVERLTTTIGAASDPWHVYLLKDATFKNAAATRGNHIFVWTGMLDATKSDDELAAVIGHEVGHVLARHTDADPNENIRKAIIEVGAVAAGIAVTTVTRNPSIGQNAGQMTASLSREVGNAIAVYPYSRDRELEADHIGLFLMAKAGYDPEAAVQFWERAVQDPSFSSTLAFFSTHPPAGERLERLRGLLPSVKKGAAGATFSGAPMTSSPSLHQQSLQSPSGGSNGSGSGSRGSGNTGSASSSSPGVSGDSFDVSAILSGKRKFTQWKVVSPGAVVYSDRSRSSKALGEFRRGALLLGVKRSGGWVQIESPDAGYIESANLERTTAD